MNAVMEVKKSPSLIEKMAAKYSVDASKMLGTLKATAFKGEVSNEQMMALMIVADQYSLNPWTKEIYAFPDKNNGIVPVVGVDGWSRIINDHRDFDGMEFVEGPLDEKQIPTWIECVIFRKDRNHPVKVREYLAECRRDTPPWKSHPRRMLRHKAMIQCARLAFGYAGIYDQDEAERIIDADVRVVQSTEVIDDLNARIVPTEKPAGLTFAQVEQKMVEAKDVDALDAAADLISEVPDVRQRDELTALYRDFRAKLED